MTPSYDSTVIASIVISYGIHALVFCFLLYGFQSLQRQQVRDQDFKSQFQSIKEAVLEHSKEIKDHYCGEPHVQSAEYDIPSTSPSEEYEKPVYSTTHVYACLQDYTRR